MEGQLSAELQVCLFYYQRERQSGLASGDLIPYLIADRGDRGGYPLREELPLPTQPPYTAFVGNLPFDITDGELGDHFAPNEVRSPEHLPSVTHDILCGLQQNLTYYLGQNC